ncbi:MAG: serine hydrolase [Luteitalea sp.]|nr:serine hydrolase [Luteitalea sp.]
MWQGPTSGSGPLEVVHAQLSAHQLPDVPRFSYSNPAFIYLGRTIEALTNDDYEMYVTKNILSSLGMRDAFFDRAPYHLTRHRSHSYYLTDAGLKEARFDFDTGITVSNGGLNAPLPDMAKYLAFLAGDPKKQQVHC